MNRFIKDYFTFNKRERRGIVVLVVLIVAILISLNIPSIFYQKENTDFVQFEKAISEFSAGSDSLDTNDETEEKEEEPERFIFNPNNLSEKDWLRMGLTGKQVKGIKSFEAAGGKFRKKEDLKKVYAVSEEFYNSVEDFISIPQESSGEREKPSFKKPEKKMLEVEINHADSDLFIMLKGIGPGYARRILKFRDALGGFTGIDQIMEVYGMTPVLFDSISRYLTIDTAGLIRKNINIATVDELRKHPYINWNVANAIVAYREKHGLYNNISDIRKTDLVDQDLYRKIAPYLKIE